MSVSVLSGAHAAAAGTTASPHICADGGGGGAGQDSRTSHSSPMSPNSTKASHLQSSNAGKPQNHADYSQRQMPADVTPLSAIVPAQSTSMQPIPGRRVSRRYYSNSESECVIPGNANFGHGQNFGQRKRSRYHHNNPRGYNNSRGKKRKVASYNAPLQSSSAQAAGSNYGAGVKPKVLPRVSATQQPKAPYNTTEFLIADREARESSDRDLADATVSGELSRLRPRCYSSVAGNTNQNATAVESCLNCSDSSEEDASEDEDPEFDAIFDNVTLDRIEGLSRDQVNREMLSVNKSNSLLIDKIGHLKSENHRLKNLLQQHGIDFGKHIGSSTDSTPAQVLTDGASRSSVENDKDAENRQTKCHSEE